MDFHSSVHIKGSLSKPDVELVFDDGSEPGPVSPALQMADAEVLFHDVSILEMPLLRRISESVSLAVVEFLRMMPSSIW